MPCGRRPMASFSRTTFLLSGCNTQSTTFPGGRQGRGGIRSHAGAELGAYGELAKNSGGGADDLMLSSRHCERSEAIHLSTQRKNGLLRCARNDVDGSVPTLRLQLQLLHPPV